MKKLVFKTDIKKPLKLKEKQENNPGVIAVTILSNTIN